MEERQPIWQQHQHYMRRAIREAEQAYDSDEIPVGAVVVKDDEIVGRGHNQVEQLKDPTAHAEILAISAACSTLNSKYLHGCTLYVTLEPCPMCAAALMWSKIDRIVFGALDDKAGACGSIYNLAQDEHLNHEIEVIQGIMEYDCSLLLREFFRAKRNSK
jgi:tRNA(adenine34) deaminase